MSPWDIGRNSKPGRAHVLHSTSFTRAGQPNHIGNQELSECMSCKDLMGSHKSQHNQEHQAKAFLWNLASSHTQASVSCKQ